MTDIAPADSRCFHCAKEVRLDHDERVAKMFRCPGCHAMSPAQLGAEAECERCAKVLTLDDLERQYGRFTCPYCRHETKLGGVLEVPASEVLPGQGIVGPVPSLYNRKKDIVVGSIWLGGGLAATGLVSAVGGGPLFLFLAPIAFGLVRLIRGLTAS